MRWYTVRSLCTWPRRCRYVRNTVSSTYCIRSYPVSPWVENNCHCLPEAGKVRVTWSRPTLRLGQRITGYSVQYRRRGTTSFTTHSVSGSSTTSYTITNLDLGTAYEVRVASVGPLGLSGYCYTNGNWVTTYNSECEVYKEALNILMFDSKE